MISPLNIVRKFQNYKNEISDFIIIKEVASFSVSVVAKTLLIANCHSK